MVSTTARPPSERPAGGGAAVKIPEYLDALQITALIDNAPHTDCELIMMLQWRAGLRIAEALGVAVSDCDLAGGLLKVRFGKGGKQRLVPIHPQLGGAIGNHIRFNRIRSGQLVGTKTVSTAWRWYQAAVKKALEKDAIPSGRHISTHTFRHSAARHWLENGVPINQVQIWLGHAQLITTLRYLALVPDPGHHMQLVP